MKQGLPLTPKTTKGARRKWDTAKHDIAMLDVGRRRQTLGKSVRNHKVGAKRNETKSFVAHKLPYKITTNVNVAGEFTSNGIFRHGHAGEIVFINVGGCKLRNGKIAEDFAEVNNLLTTLRGSDKFGFRSRQGNRILAARLPGNSTTIEHEDIACMGTTCFNVSSPIRIHPPPKHIASVSGVMSVTRVVNRLVKGTTKVAKDMLGGSHVFGARVLNEFAKLRVGPSKIGAGHVDKVAEAAHDATVAGVKGSIRV